MMSRSWSRGRDPAESISMQRIKSREVGIFATTILDNDLRIANQSSERVEKGPPNQNPPS